ncbi:MAG TPA: siderophore-interacting protein [Nocardioides sp.]|nr:siderophore-interacting protein [Nocardioides sp.]
MIHDEVTVLRAERLSPSFVRVELGGPCLADFGVDGPRYDQRIKLVLPGGPMRTYTVRDVRGGGPDTRLVVDFVVHGDDHGAVGPACAWARRAAVGDRLVVMAPRRGEAFGGIEFEPGTARRLLLVGDESALPAIAAILEQLPWDAAGVVFVEVPQAADVQKVPHPEGIDVVWLPRDGEPHGALLRGAVLGHLGAVPDPAGEEEVAVDPDLWETPTYSSSGEDVGSHAAPVRPGLDDLYAWIAGESAVVTGLRRVLVKELAMDRRQVAFMGYWRRGVPMRG